MCPTPVIELQQQPTSIKKNNILKSKDIKILIKILNNTT